ncbi:MAG: bifunctional oligoribonuclease/PAP phosphatase NrnA [Gemmatimonadota bacterium]|nr:MAG: bifunctional oligoribonuclease/PAP phosphatase NrnA [Gemmatimonadota bacterium]
MSGRAKHRSELTRRIAERLGRASSIAVSTHLGGDGDGWGSACALAHHFGAVGIDVRLLAASPMPERFRFLLPESSELWPPDRTGIEALETAEVQVVVDASEPGRLGRFANHFQPQRTIVIDHHAVATREIESALSLIDPDAAATVEVLYEVLLETGTPVSPATARALYVGLVTDTGSFRYSNTSARAHRLAAALIEAGADPGALYRPLFANLTSAELVTLRAVIEGLERDPELGITWSSLGARLLREVGALDEYEGIIDHLRSLSGTEVAILFRELQAGLVKVSLRSTGDTNVAELARSFGGGGHERAAGATVEGDLAEVRRRVLEAVRGLRGGRPGKT